MLCQISARHRLAAQVSSWHGIRQHCSAFLQHVSWQDIQQRRDSSGIDDSFQTLREKLLRVTTEDPLQRLYDAGVVYRGHAKASPGIYALLWRWHAGEASEACLAAMTELVRYGQAEGKIRRDDPHLIAWSIWSAVHGFVNSRHDPNMIRPSTMTMRPIPFLLRLLIRGVRTPQTVSEGTATIADTSRS